MGISSGTNLAPINDNIDTEHGLTRLEMQDIISTLQTVLVGHLDENQTLIEALSGSGGQVDSTATQINMHTTTKTGEILTELTNTAAGSLYALLAGKVGNDTQAVIDQLKTELVRTTAGSLYKIIVDNVLTGASPYSAKNVHADLSELIGQRATPADVVSEVTRTSSGSLYNKLQTVINAGRDAVKAEVKRTTSGSLYALLNAAIVAARDSIKGGYSIKQARDSIFTARDEVKAHINATRSVIKSTRVYSYQGNTGADGKVDVPITAVNKDKSYVQLQNKYYSSAYEIYTYEVINDTTVRITNVINPTADQVRSTFVVVEYV